LEPIEGDAWAALAALSRPVAPRSGLRDRLMSRVAQFQQLRPEVEIPAADGVWKPFGEGIAIQHLFTDPDSGMRTMLIRMEPGAVMEPHFHHHREQCLVIEGDIGWGDRVYRAGDFMVQSAQTHHSKVRSESGVLMLIIAGRNEFAR
jgi:anti-sigma factor ChrR (cupin superfamily)